MTQREPGGKDGEEHTRKREQPVWGPWGRNVPGVLGNSQEAREAKPQWMRGRAGEGEGIEASEGWTLSGLGKDLALTQWELRSCCRVLNRGVIQSDLHFRRSTLVTVWRINCKGRSREIRQGATATLQAREDAGAEGGNWYPRNRTWLEGECADRSGCEKGSRRTRGFWPEQLKEWNHYYLSWENCMIRAT